MLKEAITMSEKVVLILADGLRPDAMQSCGHPFVETMKERSTYALNAQTVMPSVTLPCHMSLFHSVDPARHGTTTNTFAPQVRPIDGLVDVLAAAKKKCGFFYTWEQLRDIARPGKWNAVEFLRCAQYKDANQLITPRAIRYIQEQDPDFVFLYLADTDDTGHAYGWMGKEYMQDAYDAMECVKQVCDSISKEHTVIFLADHGGHDRTHGTELPEDMTIPLFFMGPRFEQGKVLSEASIKDVAPTVAALLGVAPADEWEGTARV